MRRLKGGSGDRMAIAWRMAERAKVVRPTLSMTSKVARFCGRRRQRSPYSVVDDVKGRQSDILEGLPWNNIDDDKDRRIGSSGIVDIQEY